MNDDDDTDHVAPHAPHLSDELNRFAADLARLRPRDDRLDRERLAFLAGQASVVGLSNKPAKLLGVSLESRVWPAAFAVMTSVAAVLFGLLITQAAGPTSMAIAVQDCPGRKYNENATERSDDRALLTTRDAHRADIEARLTSIALSRIDTDGSSQTTADRDVPVFTPKTWHQVIHDVEPAKPSSHDSSGFLQNRDAKS